MQEEVKGGENHASWGSASSSSMPYLSNYSLQVPSPGRVHSSVCRQGRTSGGSEEREEKVPHTEVFHPPDNFARVPFCLPSCGRLQGCRLPFAQRAEVRGRGDVSTCKVSAQRLATSLSVSWRANAMCRIWVGNERFYWHCDLMFWEARYTLLRRMA